MPPMSGLAKAHETHISAFQDPEETPARLPQSQLEQERSRDSRPPPSRRSQTPDAGLVAALAMSPVPQRFRLARSMRMQRSGEFGRTRERGQRLVRGGLILNWRPREEAAHSRLGVVTSRKVGGAVIRSRARRMVREAFRRLQPGIQPPCDVVVVVRPSLKRLGGGEVQRQLAKALSAAHILVGGS